MSTRSPSRGRGCGRRRSATRCCGSTRPTRSTKLSGVPAGWTNRRCKLTATAATRSRGWRPTAAPGPSPRSGSTAALPSSRRRLGDRGVIATGAHSVAYYARDAGRQRRRRGRATAWPTRRRRPTVRIDREPPEVAFANSQDPADPERIEARVADPLSGPDPRGDRSRSAAPAPASASTRCRPRRRAEGCAPAGTRAPTRPASTSCEPSPTTSPATATVDTAAGNGAAMALSEPAEDRDATFGGRPRRRLRRAARREVAYGGRRPLRPGPAERRPRRTPLAGVPVKIVERFAAGASRAGADHRRSTPAPAGPSPSARAPARAAGSPRLAGRGR